MLKDFRASEYSEWMTVGWLLFSISDGCPEGLDLWLDFSSKCAEKYDESSCIYHWERMVRKEYTIKTLHYFAKQDNPEMYNDYIKNIQTHHPSAYIEFEAICKKIDDLKNINNIPQNGNILHS